ALDLQPLPTRRSSDLGNSELVETLADLLPAVFVRAIPQRCHGEKLLSSLGTVSCFFDCLVEQFHDAFLWGEYGVCCVPRSPGIRSEEHTSELQSRFDL